MTTTRKPAKRPAKKPPAARRPAKKAAAGRLPVNATLAAVRKHPDTAAAVLEAELASDRPRASLVGVLQTMVKPSTPGPKPPPDPRMWDVLEARRGGATVHAIADELHVSEADVERMFARAMDLLRVPSVADQVRLEHARLDRLQAALWSKSVRGDAEALGQLLQVMRDRAAQPRALDISEDRARGPVETATQAEAEKLARHAPALAAACVLLARTVDDLAGDPALNTAALRELRISMTQLRGLAGTRPDDDAGDAGERPTGTAGVVVPAGRLEQLRGKVDRGYRSP